MDLFKSQYRAHCRGCCPLSKHSLQDKLILTDVWQLCCQAKFWVAQFTRLFDHLSEDFLFFFDLEIKSEMEACENQALPLR